MQLTFKDYMLLGLIAIWLGIALWKIVKQHKLGGSICGGNCSHCKGCKDSASRDQIL